MTKHVNFVTAVVKKFKCEYSFGEGSCGCTISKHKTNISIRTNTETEESIACKLCSVSSDRKENLNVPMMKDHMKGKSENSVSKDSKQHVNFVTGAVKEMRI